MPRKDDEARALEAAQAAAAELEYDPRDVSLGRWDYRGRREVFVGSRYIGSLEVSATVKFRGVRRPS